MITMMAYLLIRLAYKNELPIYAAIILSFAFSWIDCIFELLPIMLG